MRRNRKDNFWTNDFTQDFLISGLTGELNTADSDLDIKDHQLSGGQNIISPSDSSLGKRDGITLYGNFIDSGNGIDGGFSFVGSNGTQEELVVCGGSLYRLVGGVWTAVTGVSLTAGKPCSGVYYADKDKFYIVNGTDNVVKYAAGSTSGDQTDAAFPKGKYVSTFQGRLIVGNIASYPNQVSYSTAGLDTFPASYYFVLPGEFNIEITGVLNYNNIHLLIFTRRRIYRLTNFVWDGSNTWASQLYELPSDFGAIYDRTIQVVNNFVYFLGQDMSNVAAVYKTDGYTVANISYQRISATTNTINAAQLNKACAVSDSVYYRCYVPISSDTTNTMGLIFDTSKNHFTTPEVHFIKGLADFSCLWTAETSNKWIVYAGTQSYGQVYKIHGNVGLYDELPEEKGFSTTGASTIAVDANPAKRAAMSFKAHNYNSTQTATLTKVILSMKKNAGTTTDLVVRIETDSSGKPSGTLVTATATADIAAFTNTSLAWKTATFSTPVSLTGGKTYWIVVQHKTEGSGNSQYYLATATNGYSYGTTASYASGTWSAGSAIANFGAYFESPIDAYFITKAYQPNKGREYSLKKFQTVFSNLSSAGTSMNIALANDQYESYKTYALTLNASSSIVFGTTASGGSNAIYGTTSSGGTGAIYGVQKRQFNWSSIDNFAGRLLKLKIGNNSANQQFEFNQINMIIAPRYRNY